MVAKRGAVIWMVDRTRIVTRQKCPRKRFLGFDYHGTGLAPIAKSQPLEYGTVLHEGLSLIWKDTSFPRVMDICVQMLQERLALQEGKPPFFIEEQVHLLAAQLTHFYTYRRDQLRKDYDLIETEVEREWDLGKGVVQMMRFDAILRHRRTGGLYVWDAKTVSTPTYQWQQGWEHDAQVLSYVQACEELWGEPCEGLLIEGFVKGKYGVETSKNLPWSGLPIQHSPYCYGYQKDGLTTTKWRAGAKKVPLYRGETRLLVPNILEKLMSPEERSEQCIVMPPICPLPEHRQRWKRQVVQAELQYRAGLQWVEGSVSDSEMWERLDLIAPQHDNACFDYGRPCEFEPLCFGMVEGDPVESGQFSYRTPHHEGER